MLFFLFFVANSYDPQKPRLSHSALRCFARGWDS